MLSKAQQRLPVGKGNAQIELLEAGLGDEALRQRLAPGSLDAIICTLVLCTLPDLPRAFELFRQWLRPEGQLLVLEHIHDQRQPQRTLQSALNP
ncbi:methyltransferase domain-containing protein, partial [Arthrospira platensis SPKY1]|nr:methyltransferase domain-containing protein [Arthrospira platensis SPKY1]